VSIRLVTDVKDELVMRRVVHIMKSDHQLDRSKTGTKVTRIDRAAVYHIMTEFLTEGAELPYGEGLYILRRIDFLKKSV
jgi:hypothetical protein